jgi:hypothetical protein
MEIMFHSDFLKNKDFSKLKHSIDSNEDPFTTNGLKIAIIEDLNDLRKKIELLIDYIILRNDNGLIDKLVEIKKENFRND